MKQDILDGLKKLASFGWYATGLMTTGEMQYYSKRSTTKSRKYLDKQLANYYATHFEIIIQDLIKHNIKREKILKEAAKAHKLKLYFASTALFLTQADGICDGSLFKLKNSKKI